MMSSTEKITELLTQMHMECRYSSDTADGDGSSSTHVVDVTHHQPVTTSPSQYYHHLPPSSSSMGLGLGLSRAQENELWKMAYESHSRGEHQLALSQFYPICHFAKVAVNMGIISATLGDMSSALLWYHYSVELDPYLTAGWLQLGYVYFVQYRDEEALYCFDQAFLTLRGNEFIDYSVSGMPYKIYKCELHYNRSMCLDQMGRANQAYRELILGARSAKTKEHVDIIVKLAQHGFESVQDIVLFCIPKDLIFGHRSFMSPDRKGLVSSSPDPKGDLYVEDLGTPSIYSTLTSLSSTTSSFKQETVAPPSCSSSPSTTPVNHNHDTLESRPSRMRTTFRAKSNNTLSSQKSSSSSVSSASPFRSHRALHLPLGSAESPTRLTSKRSSSSFRLSFLTKFSSKRSSNGSRSEDVRQSDSSSSGQRSLHRTPQNELDDENDRPFHQAVYEAPGQISAPNPPPYNSL